MGQVLVGDSPAQRMLTEHQGIGPESTGSGCATTTIAVQGRPVSFIISNFPGLPLKPGKSRGTPSGFAVTIIR